MAEFFYMDGYAFYVWSSYGLTLIVLLANVLWSRHRLKQVREQTFRRALQRRSEA